MTIVANLDLGGSHAWPNPSGGQVMGSVIVEGSRTTVWPRGAIEERQEVLFGVTAWQGLGGSPANNMAALQYLLHQLRELSLNPNLQPVYVRWTSTSQPGGQLNVADLDDGWYVIENLQPDYTRSVVAGFVPVRASCARVAGATPATLALTYAGAALASTYTSLPSIVLGFPIGAVPAYAGTSRVGAEGSIPIAVPAAFTTSYVPLVRPATVAALWTGGVTMWDTISTAGNPVPTAGLATNANWVQVYGGNHNFTGDVVVTNGLLLFLFQAGQAQLVTVYYWNTNTSAWASIGTLRYQDNAGNNATLQEVNLDRVSFQEGRWRISASTSAGQWASFRMRLLAGHQDAVVEFWPLTQSATNQLALVWSAATPYATGITDTTTSTTFPSNLAPTTSAGYAIAQAAASSSPVFGFLFQNPPTTAQGRLSTSSLFGYGDAVGPVAGSYKTYGIFVVPTTGTVSTTTSRALGLARFQEFLADIRSPRWTMG
jgi:hypothetical protein